MKPDATVTSLSELEPRAARKTRKRRKKRRALRRFAFFAAAMASALILFAGWFFLTPGGTEWRFLMADTLITTQHRHWAKYLIGEKGLKARVADYERQFEAMAEVESTLPVYIPPPAEQEKKPLYEIEPIEGPKFKGYLLIVPDPKKIRLAVPDKVGKGEKVSDMVARTGAVAGVNAGGFVDPEGMGNGFQPIGIVIANGQIYYNDGPMDAPTQIVGIDKDGRMVAGKYTPAELLAMGVKEAVTFSPKFIVDGKGLIKNEASGWGIAPRTCMAQKADGTILFAIIDGRQPHSIGATLYDVQQIFLERGAVIAANLDGGSSTVLVKNDESSGVTIVNKPASPYGERYLPTAFLVFEHPEAVEIKNVWAGLDIRDIDPDKW